MTDPSPRPDPMPPGPAAPDPAQGRFVRHLELRVERLDGVNAGKLRVSTPQARGWATTVRGPEQLWSALNQAINEATIAGYARWKGVQPDLDALTDEDDPTEPARRNVVSIDELVERADNPRPWARRSRRMTRPDVADPADWRPNADGTWSSPTSNRRWRADTPHLQRVLEKRRWRGLSTSYAEDIALPDEEQE